MKITSLEIERFGLWTGLTLPDLSDGINVFYGANETGKSTILEFIRSTLYGFGTDRQRFAQTPNKASQFRSLDAGHPNAQFVPSGGVLEIETRNGDQYRLRRIFQPDKPGGTEQIDIQTADGIRQGPQLLRALVSGVDEQTFNSIFAIGLDELQRLASLNDTEAAEMLFRLSVGMDRMAIVETIKELSARRNGILDIAETEGKPSLLTQLLLRRTKIVGELSETKLLIRQYAQLRNEQRIVDRTVANLEEDHVKLLKEKRLYEIAKNAEPIWIRRSQIREEIDAMGTVVAVSDTIMQQLTSIETELTERRSAYEKVKEAHQRSRKEIADLPISEKVTKLAPRIEFLLEEESRIVELDKEINTLESEIDEYNSRIAEMESQHRRGQHPRPRTDVVKKEAAGESSVAVPTNVLEEYRSYAKSVSKSRKRLSQARVQRAELQHRYRELNDKLTVELSKREVSELSEAADRTSDMVNQLRRRQSIGQKIAEMITHHRELSRGNAFLIQHQALPGWMFALMILSGLAGAFSIVVLGVMPQLAGVDPKLSPIFIILGILLITCPVVAKHFAEKNNAKKLAHNQQQLAGLTAQIDRAKQEAAAIDLRFPAAGTAPSAVSIEGRLQDAQQELAAIEKLIPLEAQRQEVHQKLKQSEMRLKQCKANTASATKRWQDWLHRVGLPGDWTPARIREYLNRCDSVGNLKAELAKRCDTVNQRVKDIKIITNRIDQLVAEIGLAVPDGASYVEIFPALRKKLEENNMAVQKRDKLVKGIKDLRKMGRKVLADLQKAKQQEIDLLRQFSVKTPEELRDLHGRHQKHRRLLTQEQGIQRELDAAIGNFCSESTLGNLLEPRIAKKQLIEKAEREQRRQLEETGVEYHGEPFAEELAKLEPLPEIEDLLKDVSRRIETVSAKLHEELQNRGQLTEQIKQIAEDQTATKKQRELAIVDEEIRKAQYDWQVYAVCTRMLDEIRAIYERDRQPRTLAEASEILKRLTEGRYIRIWAPLGDETLLVDDREENTFDLSWIARGAREQLFIALRLALASEFARHGSVLPLILDDVLVNFDTQRARAAVQVLQDVASSGAGRQIFLFTCHEHVCQLFQEMKIPVRKLPTNNSPTR